MSAPRWTIVEYRGPEGLAQLEQDWRRLYDAMPDPSIWHSFEACSVYVEQLCSAPESLRLLALTDGESVQAILPLEERQDRALGIPLRVLWPCMNGAFWLADVIGPEGDARRELLPAVVRFLGKQRGRPALMSLGRISGESTLWDGLAEIGRSEQMVYPDGSECVFRCDRTIEEFNASLSGKTRGSLRADERKFAALDGARHVRAVERDDLEREYAVFLDVEASGWKGAAGSAIKQRPQRAAFYRALAMSLTRDGHCEIHAMYAGDECIATAFSVFTHRRCATLKSGYNEAYSHIGPGLLLTHKTLEWCCADPEIDSVTEVSDVPWLRRWRPDAIGVRGSYLALRPLSGRLLVLLMRFRFGPMRWLVRTLKARGDGARKHG